MAVERLKNIFRKKQIKVDSKPEPPSPFDQKITEMLAHFAKADNYPVYNYESPNEKKPEGEEPPK